MEKRLILALVLAMAVLYVFNILGPKEKKSPIQVPVSEQQIVSDPANKQETPKNDFVSPEAFIEKEDMKNLLVQETTDELENAAGRVMFSNIGGSIKRISIKKYWRKGQENEEETIYVQNTPGQGMFSLGTALLPGLSSKAFTVEKENNSLTYDYTENEWMQIVKKYTFNDISDSLDAEITIKNLSKREMVLSFSVSGPADLETDSKVAGRSFKEADLFSEGKIIKKKSIKNAERIAGQFDWVALKDRYFALILRPFSSTQGVMLEPGNDKSIKISLSSMKHTLKPGEEKTFRYLLYAGPLDQKRLEAIGNNMDKIVNYGFFGGISKMLLSVLRTFYNWFHNWGLAIIFLTLLINLALFPLTTKSFTAMQQMKTIQPHLVKLKELHKDNPQKLNKETMELYKKYNVNPLGGCLPLLLQMPIFISLYQGLIRSVELKGANFLWIKDLAKPDAVPIPVTLPVIGNHINILPILMCIFMFLQQRISTASASGNAVTDEQANQQKMMMIFMPIFFGFLFYNMPSGLVLYWLTNTILMTSEHAIMSKNMNKG